MYAVPACPQFAPALHLPLRPLRPCFLCSFGVFSFFLHLAAQEWKMYAERVDRLEGHDEWRKRPDSLLYNHKVTCVTARCLLWAAVFLAFLPEACDEHVL